MESVEQVCLEMTIFHSTSREMLQRIQHSRAIYSTSMLSYEKCMIKKSKP